MISALVVSHDSAEDLPACLASLDAQATQDEHELEVIVVDTASEDGSVRLLRTDHPSVQLVELESNVGFGVACNLGVRQARGDSLLLLNPDARLGEGALAAMAARLAEAPDLAAVAPRLVSPSGRSQHGWSPDRSLIGEAVQRLRNPIQGSWLDRGPVESLLRRVMGPGWFSAACLLLRREAFESVGGFDQGYFLYFEDADLCVRLRRTGWRLAEVPSATAVHAGRAGQSRSPWLEAVYRRSQIRYYRKHRPRWERRVLRRYLRMIHGAAEVELWTREERER